MAGSGLAHFVRRLAADHAIAEAVGTTPEAVNARRAETRELSRRQLLGGAAAVAGAASLAQVPFAHPADAAGAPRIAIIGAGISGLAAALRLQDSGLASTVYEANTRIGGRGDSNTTTKASRPGAGGGGGVLHNPPQNRPNLGKAVHLPP